MIHYQRIYSQEDILFPLCWELYQSAFPEVERREESYHLETMELKPFRAEVIFDDDVAIGILFWWELTHFRYIEHFATSPQQRGKGYGKEALKEFISRSDKPILLEVEHPAVDIVAGPDAYRSLPSLLREATLGVRGANTILSTEETYAEVAPVRLDKSGVSAFVAIMRGCNNYCSYCVVPYTRGRERSRDAETILGEVRSLFENGYREVTLLGQNVNSYRCEEIDFPKLIEKVAAISPLLRVRFATSHPKDMSDELLEVMAANQNICRAIHLPAQSGSTAMLERMNRKYTREWYMGRIEAIRRLMPDCAITTDIIAGFSGESDEEHQATISLMQEVGYEFAYMFKYSEREGTYAHKNLPDDISEELKTARLTEIINLQNELSAESNKRDVGKEFEVLVEGESKRSSAQMFGRNSQNKVVVFDREDARVGDYVRVVVESCSSATLIGKIIK